LTYQRPAFKVQARAGLALRNRGIGCRLPPWIPTSLEAANAIFRERAPS
jgi:hypothetical protein